MADTDPEFTALIAAVETIGKLDDAHKCCDEHGETPCWENRYYTAALVMERLGCDLTDIGFIVDKLLELQCEETVEPAATNDDVLNAKELL